MADMKNCKYCNKEMIPQGLKNHERNCSENPYNIKKEELVAVEETTEVTTIEETTPEVTPTLPVIEEVKKEEVVEEVLVPVVTNQDLRPYIGNKYYEFKKNISQNVPQNVKDILKRAGMLKAI